MGELNYIVIKPRFYAEELSLVYNFNIIFCESYVLWLSLINSFKLEDP